MTCPPSLGAKRGPRGTRPRLSAPVGSRTTVPPPDRTLGWSDSPDSPDNPDVEIEHDEDDEDDESDVMTGLEAKEERTDDERELGDGDEE